MRSSTTARSSRCATAATVAEWRDTLEAWASVSVTAEEYRELDDERIIVLHRFRARGRMSGLEVDESMTTGR
jgi:hypothetical protein